MFIIDQSQNILQIKLSFHPPFESTTAFLLLQVCGHSHTSIFVH